MARKPYQNAQEPEQPKELPMEAAPVIAEHPQWRYHRTEPDRLFLNGEEIPDGWEDHKLS